jgi:hypothetical protein
MCQPCQFLSPKQSETVQNGLERPKMAHTSLKLFELAQNGFLFEFETQSVQKWLKTIMNLYDWEWV